MKDLYCHRIWLSPFKYRLDKRTYPSLSFLIWLLHGLNASNPGLSGPTYHPWSQILHSTCTFVSPPDPQVVLTLLEAASHGAVRKVPELAGGNLGNKFWKVIPNYGDYHWHRIFAGRLESGSILCIKMWVKLDWRNKKSTNLISFISWITAVIHTLVQGKKKKRIPKLNKIHLRNFL